MNFTSRSIATQEEQKKARNAAAKQIESVKAKHPIPDFMYQNEQIADIMVDYIKTLSERMEAHVAATGVDPDIALSNLIDSIEGDINRQVDLIEDWNNKIIAKASGLKDALAAG